MREKHERFVHPRLFYAFVDLEPPSPVVYVMPSVVVADVLTRSHQAWLALPGRAGRAHRDNDMRRVVPSFSHQVAGFPPGWLDAYRDRWDLLTDDDQADPVSAQLRAGVDDESSVR